MKVATCLIECWNWSERNRYSLKTEWWVFEGKFLSFSVPNTILHWFMLSLILLVRLNWNCVFLVKLFLAVASSFFFCLSKSCFGGIVDLRFLGLSFRDFVGLSVVVMGRFSDSWVRGVSLGEFFDSSMDSCGSCRRSSSVILSLDSRETRSETG